MYFLSKLSRLLQVYGRPGVVLYLLEAVLSLEEL